MKRVFRNGVFLSILCFSSLVKAQVPAISSVSPMGSYPGLVVTISGAGINAVPAANIVYFGATRASVTAAGIGFLTALVPEGATFSTVSVTNTASGLTGWSQYPFLPSFDNTPYVAGITNFDAPLDLTAGDAPSDVALGDIDADGKADLIVVNANSNTMTVYRNTTTEDVIDTDSYAAGVDFMTSTTPSGVAVADLDGDGRLDIVVANEGSNTVSVYHNTGVSGVIDASTLASRVDFATAAGPVAVTADDVDGDGKPEILVTGSTDNVVSVLRNTATTGVLNTGSFSFHEDFATGTNPRGVATGDIDGDDKSDVLVVNSTDNTLSVLRNTSTSGVIDPTTFAAAVNFVVGTTPSAVVVADVDADGKPDVAVVNSGSDNVSVLRNTASSGIISSGSLAAVVDFATGGSPADLGIGDLDGDGRPDVAVVNTADGTVSVLRNAGVTGSVSTSSFEGAVDFQQNGSPVAIAVGDADGDDEAELFCADGTADVVSVLRNNPLAPIAGTGIACVGATDTLTDASGTGTWSSASTLIATVGSSNGVVSGVSVGTVEITYTVAGGFTTTVVTVNDVPDAGTVSGSATACAGDAVVFTTSGEAGGVWSSSDATVATVGAGGTVTAVGGGTATIYYTLATVCGTDVDSADISVTSLADAGTISGPAEVCVGSEISLSSTASGGVWSSSDAGIAAVDTAGMVSGVTDGTATISYIHTNSCGADTTSYAVTVNPIPAAISGTDNVCNGFMVTLASTTTGGTWNSPDATVSVDAATGEVTGVVAGTATVSYTLSVTGCSSTLAFTVNAQPAAIGGLHHVCEGGTRTLSNTLSGGSWSSTDAAVVTINATTGVMSGIAPGTATISYTMATGCYVTAEVTTNPTPGPITGDPTVCLGFTDTLFNASPGGTWSSSLPPLASVGITSGIIGGHFVGTARISYTTTGACSSVVTVSVLPSPDPVTGTGVVCEGLTTTLSSSAFGGNWVSSDTTIAVVVVPTGVIGGVSAGTASVSYVLTNGCYRSAVVTVNPSPDEITGGSAVCTGDTIMLDCATSGGSWSSGHATASIGSASGIVTGVTSGTTAISYTLPTGCRSTRFVTVNQTPAPITGATEVCQGLTTILSTTTAPGTWSSDDASIATIIPVAGVLTGVAPGTTTITFTVPGSGCFTTHTMTVNNLPDPISGSGTVCEGSITTLSSAGTPGGEWSSSDISTAIADLTSGNILGVVAGTVTVTYTLPTGCIATTEMTVEPLPHAGLLTGDSLVCEGASITLTPSVAGGTWSTTSSGHASVGTTGDVTGVSGGVDIVSYSITNTCGTDVVAQHVTVNPLPAVGSFTGNNNVCIGKTRFFSNSLSGGAWSSSDAAVATVASGTVFGVALGTATISYTRTNACGSTSATTEVTVHALVDPGTLSGTDSICIGEVVAISATIAGGTWSSSSAWVASISVDGDVTGHYPGGTFIRYEVSNSCSTDTASMLLTVRSPVDCPTAVNGPELVSKEVRIFPNPSDGAFSVNTPVAGTLSVVAADGRVVASYDVEKGEAEMHLPSNISAGMYVCRFARADGTTAMLKLVYKP